MLASARTGLVEAAWRGGGRGWRIPAIAALGHDHREAAVQAEDDSDLDGQVGYGPGVVGRAVHLVAPQHRAQHRLEVHHGVALADAGARPRAERGEAERRPAPDLLGQEPADRGRSSQLEMTTNLCVFSFRYHANALASSLAFRSFGWMFVVA